MATKKLRSRWKKPDPDIPETAKNVRYTQAQQNINDRLLREQPGWHKGARIK